MGVDAIGARSSSIQSASPRRESKSSETSLTQEEKKAVQQLRSRDREVRSHEQAHLSALGPYRSGGASYTTVTGPDGNSYAVEGEVPVNISPGNSPEETIQKARAIRRAALAPANPSGADRAAAAQASALEAEALGQLAEERKEKREAAGEGNGSGATQSAQPIGASRSFESGAFCANCGALYFGDHGHSLATG